MQIIKVPGLNNLGKNNGCRNAGNAILAELKKIKDISMIELEEIHVDNSRIDEQEKLIYENSKEAFEKHEKLLFLGGDHSISYSIGRAFLKEFGDDSCLIIFDAHPDTMPSMKEPTHEEWLRALVEKGFNPENVLLVGLRKIELEERRFLDSKRIKYFEFGKFEDNELLCDSIMEFARKNRDSKVYLSIDIDVVDPAFAPSTGYLEPGGFTSREILYFAKRLAKLPNLLAVDIVEIDCESDINKGNVTVKLGARILGVFL